MNTRENKLKYLMILNAQYKSGRITKKEFKKELKFTRKIK